MNHHIYKHFRYEVDTSGVATVSLGVHGRPLNVLTAEVLEELDDIIKDLENNVQAKIVLFRSHKESGFLGGADVQEIASLKTGADAMLAIERGQTLLQRIEWLSMPTVAVLHGPCLGGGLELALACDYRIARENSSTKIGLPEIKLGLIPGWGGTQRLPRKVGLTEALSMILTGRFLTATEAYRIGLLDRAISPDRWEYEIEEFVRDCLAGKVPSSKRRLPLMSRLLDKTSVGRALIMRITERRTRSQRRHYPAVAAALRAVRAGFKKGPDGFLTERDEFVDLLATPTCRHLLDLFFARERARNLSTWTSDVGKLMHHPKPIRKIGVVGAGAMGAGIGQLAAVRGFNVAIKEIDPDAANAGRKRIEKLIASLAKRKAWDEQETRDVQARVEIGHHQHVLSDCDLVIEAVVEQMEVKKDVFQKLDRIVAPDAIFVTNTSSLSVSEMAEATSRKANFAGLHFFNPVHRMELVEVVRGAQTDDQTIARLTALVKALGKTPVVTADAPGFLVNRVLFPYLGEAVLMVAEQHEVAKIDAEVRRFGMPMGPLRLLDEVGLDVAAHVAGSLRSTLPHVDLIHDRLQAMVEHGYLGKKVGRGFYEYKRGKSKGQSRMPMEMVSEDLSSESFLEQAFADDGMTLTQRRLIYPMLAESVRCHQEQVVEQPWAIDLAMVLGTGFAPHRGGPLHVIDQIGLSTVAANLKSLADVLGDRFAAPAELLRMVEHDERYFGPVDPLQPAMSGSS